MVYRTRRNSRKKAIVIHLNSLATEHSFLKMQLIGAINLQKVIMLQMTVMSTNVARKMTKDLSMSGKKFLGSQLLPKGINKPKGGTQS